MDFLPPVVATLLADIGEFSAGFGKAEAQLTGFEAAQKKMAAAGKVAMAALAVGVVAVGVESVKMAAGFDQAMELIHTQAGASQAEVDTLKQKVLDLAPTVGIGPEKLAEGLYHVESAGFRAQEALDITAAAARDAAIGMGDMETTTQALIGVMASGIGGVKDAADAAAYLNQIVGIGDMRMDKLAASISTGILPSFRSAGLQMNDFGAALATITDNATPADEAATRLRMTVSLMSAPSHAATKALESIGIGSMQLADDMRKPNGLLTAVMDLKDHLEKSGKTASEQNQVIQKAFGGGKTSGAILTLLEESDRLKDKYNELGTSASRGAKFQDAWASQQQQFTQQLHQLGAEAQVVGITIGNFLIPKIQQFAGWLAKHTGEAKLAAIAIGGVLVAAMGAFTASLIANAAAALADPVVWIIIAIIAAVALLVVGIYELVKHWGTVWGFIKRIALDVWHWLVDAWHVTIHALETAAMWVKTKVVDPIAHFFKVYLLNPALAVFHALDAAWTWVWTRARNTIMFYVGFLQGFFGVIKAEIMTVLLPVFHVLEAAWTATWNLISAVATWAWNNVIKPVADFIVNYGVRPVVAAAQWLGTEWDRIWHWIGQAAQWAWNNVIKPVAGFIMANGITPIHDSISWLGTEWDRIWHGITSVVDWAWTHVLKPTFGAISSAWGFVKDIWNTVTGGGSQKTGQGIGAGVASYDTGGLVPGLPGQPQFAVVHGGEYVLTRDMVAALGSTGVRSGGAGHTSIGQGTPGAPIVVQANLYLDGKLIHRVLIPVAQQTKARTGSTGLA